MQGQKRGWERSLAATFITGLSNYCSVVMVAHDFTRTTKWRLESCTVMVKVTGVPGYQDFCNACSIDGNGINCCGNSTVTGTDFVTVPGVCNLVSGDGFFDTPPQWWWRSQWRWWAYNQANYPNIQTAKVKHGHALRVKRIFKKTI